MAGALNVFGTYKLLKALTTWFMVNNFKLSTEAASKQLKDCFRFLRLTELLLYFTSPEVSSRSNMLVK